jgi:outer membrane lipoprotein SlyB
MNIKTYLFASALVTSMTFLTGCQATSQGGRTFTPSQAQTAMQSFHGTILHVAVVQIQHEEKGGGAVVGTLLGGIAGSTVGGGRGTRLATAGGAAAGAAAGSAAERKRATRPAWELEVELEDGKILVIVQEQDDDFAVGDNVRVIKANDGTYRVRQ